MATTLLMKLRLGSGQKALILNAPEDYITSLGELPEDLQLSEIAEGRYDFVQVFARDSAEFAEVVPAALGAVDYDGLFWISYPKKSSRLKSDLSREVVWQLMEDSGLRPVTQVSVDQIWSALRFRPHEKVGS